MMGRIISVGAFFSISDSVTLFKSVALISDCSFESISCVIVAEIVVL